MISFNSPYMIGDELNYINYALSKGKISRNDYYTQKYHNFFMETFGFKNCLLTFSYTNALEMAATLIDLKSGDSIIMLSCAFISIANPFTLRGAKIILADSYINNLNINVQSLEKLIASKIKTIIVVHYVRVTCDMDLIISITNKNNLFVIEDATQAVDSYYKDRPLGSIGHLGAFSFHKTKKNISGEEGILVVNDEHFDQRVEATLEKGTHTSVFFGGETDKYSLVDMWASLPSGVTITFLFAQLENLQKIQSRRKLLWQN